MDYYTSDFKRVKLHIGVEVTSAAFTYLRYCSGKPGVRFPDMEILNYFFCEIFFAVMFLSLQYLLKFLCVDYRLPLPFCKD